MNTRYDHNKSNKDPLSGKYLLPAGFQRASGFIPAHIHRVPGLRPSLPCRILSFLPALAVMLMIFLFSSADGDTSSAQSSCITQLVVKAVNLITRSGWDAMQQAVYVSQWEYYIRKLAHFLEYALLGCTLIPPLYLNSLRRLRLISAAWAFCIAWAILDELHQTFSDGRSPLITDVMIDSAGAFVGIIFACLAAALLQLIIRTALPACIEK